LDMLPSTTQTVSAPGISFLYRGRDPGCSAPPAQIRACPIKALGSYHRQHVAASRIERHLARLLGVDWRAYERAVDEAG
jgi:hypothetical protein